MDNIDPLLPKLIFGNIGTGSTCSGGLGVGFWVDVLTSFFLQVVRRNEIGFIMEDKLESQ
jgi:hypothetical protein